MNERRRKVDGNSSLRKYCCRLLLFLLLFSICNVLPQAGRQKGTSLSSKQNIQKKSIFASPDTVNGRVRILVVWIVSGFYL